MTREKLAELEKRILHPNDWDKAMGYFLDHFGVHKEFMDISQKTQLPIVVKMMGEMAKYVFKKQSVAFVNPMIFRVKEFNMIHGHALVEGKTLAFVYLTHIHKGVFCIGDPLTGALFHSTRISALPLGNLDKDTDVYQEPWNDQLN